MSTNRYIDKLKARLAKEVDQRMQLQALLDDQVARNRALLAERDELKSELAELVRIVGMSVDGSSARNKAMKKAFAALQGEQP